MTSILPHNENPTFVTYNLEEHLLAIWSWDDGSELSAMGSRKYYAGSSKWTDPDNLDGNKTNGDEVDLKLWEFDNCLVQDTDPQEEQKVEDDEKEMEGNEEDEEPKTSTNECDEGVLKSATKEEPLQRVDLNQSQENHKTTGEGTGEESVEEERPGAAGETMKDTPSPVEKTFTVVSNSDGTECNALDDDVEGEKRKDLQTTQKSHDDVHAVKDTKPTAPVTFARTPPTPRRKAPLNIPAIPEDSLSPKVARENLGNIMSPASKSAKKKSKSRKSKIDKALLLDDSDSDGDDESGATSATKKKPKEGNSKRSQSLSESEEDSVVGKSKKKKKKEKTRSSGSKSKKSKMRKEIFTGELQRKLGGDDGQDGIELSPLNNALLSPRNTKKRGKRRSTWWDISALPSDDDEDGPLKLPIPPPRRATRKRN